MQIQETTLNSLDAFGDRLQRRESTESDGCEVCVRVIQNLLPCLVFLRNIYPGFSASFEREFIVLHQNVLLPSRSFQWILKHNSALKK